EFTCPECGKSVRLADLLADRDDALTTTGVLWRFVGGAALMAGMFFVSPCVAIPSLFVSRSAGRTALLAIVLGYLLFAATLAVVSYFHHRPIVQRWVDGV